MCFPLVKINEALGAGFPTRHDGFTPKRPIIPLARRVSTPGLLAACDRSAEATVVLETSVELARSRNLHVLIPDASDELVMIQSHTNRTNGPEDSGREALAASPAASGGEEAVARTRRMDGRAQLIT